MYDIDVYRWLANPRRIESDALNGTTMNEDEADEAKDKAENEAEDEDENGDEDEDKDKDKDKDQGQDEDEDQGQDEDEDQGQDEDEDEENAQRVPQPAHARTTPTLQRTGTRGGRSLRGAPQTTPTLQRTGTRGGRSLRGAPRGPRGRGSSTRGSSQGSLRSMGVTLASVRRGRGSRAGSARGTSKAISSTNSDQGLSMTARPGRGRGSKAGGSPEGSHASPGTGSGRGLGKTATVAASTSGLLPSRSGRIRKSTVEKMHQ